MVLGAVMGPFPHHPIHRCPYLSNPHLYPLPAPSIPPCLPSSCTPRTAGTLSSPPTPTRLGPRAFAPAPSATSRASDAPGAATGIGPPALTPLAPAAVGVSRRRGGCRHDQPRPRYVCTRWARPAPAGDRPGQCAPPLSACSPRGTSKHNTLGTAWIRWESTARHRPGSAQFSAPMKPRTARNRRLGRGPSFAAGNGASRAVAFRTRSCPPSRLFHETKRLHNACAFFPRTNAPRQVVAKVP